jgi:DNA-binding XRE family transcriptional regulator
MADLVERARQELEAVAPQREWQPHVVHALPNVRRAAGLTQLELAALAGIAPETLSRAERGRPARSRSIEALAAIGAMPATPSDDHSPAPPTGSSARCVVRLALQPGHD